MHIYIGGWSCETNREIVSVWFVRASGRERLGDAVWTCEIMILARLGGWRSVGAPVRGVAWRGVGSQPFGHALNLLACYLL